MTVSLSSAHQLPCRTRGAALPLFQYAAIWRQRRALAQLDDAMLRDIGVSRARALREAARPVWDIAPK